MKTAKFIKDLPHTTEIQKLYQLSEPIANSNFVVVSGTSVFPMDETSIFDANEKGKIVDWSELEGSFCGEINHHKALQNAGYSVED